MNVKILFKAMSFMFLPTLAVLTVLLVGFFNPVAMWSFIKSENGWAIFLRIIILVLEIGLVWYFYDKYLEEEALKEIKGSEFVSGKPFKCTDGYSYLSNIKYAWGHSDYFEIYETQDPNIVVLHKTVKKSN